MIPRQYKSEELVGKKCRPLREMQNGGGQGITPDTICTIVSAHYGITIKTDPCPHCGQYAKISRIDRKDLELVEVEP